MQVMTDEASRKNDNEQFQKTIFVLMNECSSYMDNLGVVANEKILDLHRQIETIETRKNTMSEEGTLMENEFKRMHVSSIITHLQSLRNLDTNSSFLRQDK